MARIRTVKPELFRHEGLYELELETKLPIRISFAGLFTACDRRGRFKWQPRQLKLDVLPYDEIDFSRVLDALLSRGFLVKYENSGAVYGCIPTFERHQVINNRETESIIPSFEDSGSFVFDFNGNLTREPRVSHASMTPLVQDKGEGKGREGNRKGMEGKGICQQADDPVQDIFNYWCLVMNKSGNAKLTPKRESVIKARLKEGYTVDHIKQAIDGCKRNPFNMGKNPNKVVYDDLELICRSGEKVEHFGMNIGSGSDLMGLSLQAYEEFINAQ